MKSRRDRREAKRKAERVRKLRNFVAIATLTAFIGSGVYFSRTNLPEWAEAAVLSTAAASDSGNAEQQQKNIEEFTKGAVVLPPPPTAPSSTTVPSSTDEQVARRVNYSNVAENQQDIPDAITRQASFAFTYYEGGLYKIYCKPGYLTDIALQPGEEITGILGGDTARWVVDKASAGSEGGKQWHVYVKPLKTGITTNFVINTNKHSYQIEVVATNWYSPMISWIYPQEEAAIFKAKEEEKKETLNLSKTSPDRLNFDYKFDKKQFRWSPEVVFDDGFKTFIRMPAGMNTDEAPALLIKNKSGELMLVNYRVQGNSYVVDRLFESAELRVGKDVVKIKRRGE